MCFLNEVSRYWASPARTTIIWTVYSSPKLWSLSEDLGYTEEMNDQVCKSVFLELPVFPVRRQVTAVCNGGIKNWSFMQRKGCRAQRDRRNVPYEKLKETGDEARARLPCLPSSSTSQQCACSRRKCAVLPVEVSGFLWASVQLTDYMQPRFCVRPRECLRARVQADVLRSDFLPRLQEWTEKQIWLQSQGKVSDGMSQGCISNFQWCFTTCHQYW